MVALLRVETMEIETWAEEVYSKLKKRVQ